MEITDYVCLAYHQCNGFMMNNILTRFEKPVYSFGRGYKGLTQCNRYTKLLTTDKYGGD